MVLQIIAKMLGAKPQAKRAKVYDELETTNAGKRWKVVVETSGKQVVSMAHHGSGDANGAACSHDVAPSSSPAAVAAAAAVPQNGSDGSARCCGRGEAVSGDTTAAAPSALQPIASDGGSANGPTPPPSDFPPPLPL